MNGQVLGAHAGLNRADGDILHGTATRQSDSRCNASCLPDGHKRGLYADRSISHVRRAQAHWHEQVGELAALGKDGAIRQVIRVARAREAVLQHHHHHHHHHHQIVQLMSRGYPVDAT